MFRFQTTQKYRKTRKRQSKKIISFVIGELSSSLTTQWLALIFEQTMIVTIAKFVLFSTGKFVSKLRKRARWGRELPNWNHLFRSPIEKKSNKLRSINYVFPEVSPSHSIMINSIQWEEFATTLLVLLLFFQVNFWPLNEPVKHLILQKYSP